MLREVAMGVMSLRHKILDEFTKSGPEPTVLDCAIDKLLFVYCNYIHVTYICATISLASLVGGT